MAFLSCIDALDQGDDERHLELMETLARTPYNLAHLEAVMQVQWPSNRSQHSDITIATHHTLERCALGDATCCASSNTYPI